MTLESREQVDPEPRVLSALPEGRPPTIRLHPVRDAGDVATVSADESWAAEVNGILDRIDAEQSTALRLVYLSRLSIAQAAARLQISERAFARQVSTAMATFSVALLGD